MGIYNPGSRTTESKLPLIRKQLTNLPYFSLRVSSQLHPINPTAYLTFFWMPQRYFQIPKFTSKSWSSPYQNLLAFFQYSLAQRIAQLSIPFHKPETRSHSLSFQFSLFPNPAILSTKLLFICTLLSTSTSPPQPKVPLSVM